VFTYPEVGATRTGELPPGYRHVRYRIPLGRGPVSFAGARSALQTWTLQRHAGLHIRATGPAAEGMDVSSGLGIGRLRIWAPCRIVWLVDEPDRYGYAYGTLPGHPETGEESFLVSRDPDGRVTFELTAFSRPARWYTRLATPLAHPPQTAVTRPYLRTMPLLARPA